MWAQERLHSIWQKTGISAFADPRFCSDVVSACSLAVAASAAPPLETTTVCQASSSRAFLHYLIVPAAHSPLTPSPPFSFSLAGISLTARRRPQSLPSPSTAWILLPAPVLRSTDAPPALTLQRPHHLSTPTVSSRSCPYHPSAYTLIQDARQRCIPLSLPMSAIFLTCYRVTDIVVSGTRFG